MRVAPSRERGSKRSRACPPGPSSAVVAPSRERGSKHRIWPVAKPSVEPRVAPSRERGSKQPEQPIAPACRLGRSLTGARIETPCHPELFPGRAVAPSRERGSKQPAHEGHQPEQRVAPSRERGSKRRDGHDRRCQRGSLPHGSADRNLTRGDGFGVAACRSLTGARIETCSCARSARSAPVAPSRERGSKPPLRRRGPRLPASLPHGSADRNTSSWAESPSRRVAPSRERGSKHLVVMASRNRRGVAPSRERGSKLRDQHRHDRDAGRSLTGARIETSKPQLDARLHPVAPSRERGSKHELNPHHALDRHVAPSRERGSKRRAFPDVLVGVGVAPSRERGSKLERDGRSRPWSGRSLTGARIETLVGSGSR